jgi:sulfite exporter TauE/SafE
MTDHLQMLGTLCGPQGSGAGVFVAMLLAGLVGSIAHCVPMCGSIVLAQVSNNLARIDVARLCECQRISNGLLLPYHAGRLTTYAVLGAVAAGSGGVIQSLPFMGWLPPALLLLGAMLFLAQAARRGLPQFGARWIGGIARRIDRSRKGAGLLLGLVLGLLPCGLLYAALTVAASTARPASGALAMVAFGAGTVPSLAVVGIVGQASGRAWTARMASFRPVLLVLNAGLLTVMAWQLLLER